MGRRGRPKKLTEIEKLDFNSFQEDIILFKNSLIDFVNEDTEEDENPINKETVKNFLKLDLWEQNIFIVYIITKDKRICNKHFTFKNLAELLKVDRNELMRAIKEIKKKLL